MSVNVVSGERQKVGVKFSCSYQGHHPWGLKHGRQSHKETTDVWEPQQSSGEKRGQSSGTERERSLLFLTSALSPRITAVD